MLANGISIHAPMKGATRRSPRLPGSTRHFNPRTHEGCDVLWLKNRPVSCSISIHAPMKGATLKENKIKR